MRPVNGIGPCLHRLQIPVFWLKRDVSLLGDSHVGYVRTMTLYHLSNAVLEHNLQAATYRFLNVVYSLILRFAFRNTSRYIQTFCDETAFFVVFTKRDGENQIVWKCPSLDAILDSAFEIHGKRALSNGKWSKYN